MLTKRIIPCLDIKNGRVTKGVKFLDNRDIGDPVTMGAHYSKEGADELVFYDITASAEDRGIFLDVVKQVAANIFIPFCVGGGINNLEQMHAVLDAGAEKISINSGAVKNPDIITDGAKAFGKQCMVLGMDVKKQEISDKLPSGYEVIINGGRLSTGRDALAWAKQAESMGAGEICLNVIDTDGMKTGYDIYITKLISSQVKIPVIASGGAGRPEHLVAVLTEGGADAALVASMVHTEGYTIRQIKEALHKAGILVRMDW